MCKYCDPKPGQSQAAVYESQEMVVQIDKSTPISRRRNSATFTIATFVGNHYKTFQADIRFCPMCGKKLIVKR